MAPLTWHRRQAGLSQRALAERAGIQWVTVHRLETGKQRAQNDTAKRIADALGVRVQDVTEFGDGDQSGE